MTSEELAERMEEAGNWERTDGDTVQCPNCLFRFGAEHTDEDGGYSCPACEEQRLSAFIGSVPLPAEGPGLAEVLAQLKSVTGTLAYVHGEEWDTVKNARALIAAFQGEK